MSIGGSKEITEIIRTIQAQGWTCEQVKSGHTKARGPSGGLVVISNSPTKSKHTSLNIKRDLRRRGAII